MIIEHTIYRDDKEIEITADVRYYRGQRGYRNSYGVPEEPDEDPYCEIESVYDTAGASIDLEPFEEEDILEKAFEELEDRRIP